MPFITNEDIEKRKATGVKMNKLNCVWNLPAEITAQVISRLLAIEPKTETEKRNKHILELAFIKDMNASQIARLNDPIIVGLGNRSKGKPLSATSIWNICHSFAPEIKKYRINREKSKAQKRRNLFFQKKLKGLINRPKVCATCGCKDDIEIHHIIPIATGGTDDYFNLISLCHSCHMKLHHSIYDWLKSSSPNIME